MSSCTARARSPPGLEWSPETAEPPGHASTVRVTAETEEAGALRESPVALGRRWRIATSDHAHRPRPSFIVTTRSKNSERQRALREQAGSVVVMTEPSIAVTREGGDAGRRLPGADLDDEAIARWLHFSQTSMNLMVTQRVNTGCQRAFRCKRGGNLPYPIDAPLHLRLVTTDAY